MRKHITKIHTHLKKRAYTHHYIAFMVILAGFAFLSICAFVTYAADEQVCDSSLTNCAITPVADDNITTTSQDSDDTYAKTIVKLKVNTLPVYQRLYGKNSKEVRGLKKLITSLTKLHNEKNNGSESSSDVSKLSFENKKSTKGVSTNTDELSQSQKIKTPIKKNKRQPKVPVKETVPENDATLIDDVEPIKEPVKPTKSPVSDALPPTTNTKKAMTWVVRERAKEGIINVGHDATTNAYAGDTDVNSMLPMLCMNKQDIKTPDILVQEYALRSKNNNSYDDAFYNGWIGGYVKMTTPIVGVMITSHDVANKICVNQLGDGWEFAEFHSPQGGRGRFAYGELPVGQRLWVGINDQPSNPWGAGW